jgi:uncharacterized membrane protein YhfC
VEVTEKVGTAVQTLAIVLQLAVMIGAPLAAVWLVYRRWRASLLLVGAGAFAWIGSQVVHVPLNEALRLVGLMRPLGPGASGLELAGQAGLLGLTAGLCEETARWLFLRYGMTQARSYREAVVFGVGHGGFESIWFGVLVGATWLSAWAALRAGPEAMGVPQEQLSAAAEAFASTLSSDPSARLLAAGERLMTMVFHVAEASLVMLSVARRRFWPLALAIVWHAAADAATVFSLARLGGAASELVLLAWMPVCGAVLLAVRRALRVTPDRSA